MALSGPLHGEDGSDPRLLLLAPADNVLVARETIPAGSTIAVAGRQVRLARALELGHKIAHAPIAAGDKVLKYGAPIGSATCAIAVGEHVHLHNMKSDYTQSHVIARPPAD